MNLSLLMDNLWSRISLHKSQMTKNMICANAHLGFVHRSVFFHCSNVSVGSGSGVAAVHGRPCPQGMTWTPSTSMVFICLRLTLCPLWFRVWSHGWIRLLYWHGAAKVRSLAQKVWFGWQTEWTFSKHHSHRWALFGTGPVTELQGGQMNCIALAQKLWWITRYEKILEKTRSILDQLWRKLNEKSVNLALILVLLGWPSHYIYLVGAEAQYAVDWNVLHGAVSAVDFNVTLPTWEKGQSVIDGLRIHWENTTVSVWLLMCETEEVSVRDGPRDAQE